MQKETTEGNALIAEFMGYKIHSFPGSCLFACKELPEPGKNPNWDFRVDLDAKYHTSWDWLMPVAKKIKDYLQYMERPSINHCCHGDMLEIDIQCHIWDIDIKQAHEAIVVWIQWYNSLNSK